MALDFGGEEEGRRGCKAKGSIGGEGGYCMLLVEQLVGCATGL